MSGIKKSIRISQTVIGTSICENLRSICVHLRFLHNHSTQMAANVRKWPQIVRVAGCIGFYILTPTSRAAPIDFVRDVRPIFEAHCYDCHSGDTRKSGLRLDVKSAAMKGGDNHGPDIIPGKAAESPLIQFLTTTNEDEIMPPKGGPLSEKDIATLTAWVNEGAVWPDGVDTLTLEDPTDHWSFKPLTKTAGKDSIDDFILEKLNENGLMMSAPADPSAWLRRVTFGLTGLPPTPGDLDAFLKDDRPDARERVVEALLDSPHYGERWAQHWLDVVRYADTHGFEVNTERPNAWPYRDYVIQSFNADTPYDQFIREQIAGDAFGKDAATGFLVTASVLLPGQIGKDEPSKRLARQDSLDEIVMNIGQTFLGLSVGCARCHDHKFDPISAKDYYAMQAFVAGVEYADRDLRTPEAEAARAEVKRLTARQAEIDKALAAFVPLAKSGVERPMINPRENADRFAPVKAKRVRFTILATNNLEPCIDELEVFNTGGANVGLDSAGAKRTSSGNIGVAERHELRFLNDGRYGNSRSWMGSEIGKGWVELEFAQEETIERVVWGRDREGKFKDRLATDYRIEIGDNAGGWTLVADASDRKKFDPAGDKAAEKFSLNGLTPDEAERAAPLLREKSANEAKIRAANNAQKVFAGKFREPDKIHLLNRGDPEQPGDLIVPAVLSSFGDLALPAETPEQKRRLVLADWIADPENPLTARVMVNRIWQGHFGSGLVPTPSDFGNNGMPPSHPELLDWLAAEFIRSGWSVKHMHRLIVLSRTYGQESRMGSRQGSGGVMEYGSDGQTHGVESVAPSPQATSPTLPHSTIAFASLQLPASRVPWEKDADVRLLWRYPSRRLEAEAIRDSILAVSGKLNPKMYGVGYNMFDQRGGLSGFNPVESFTEEGLRRMIYAHKVRRETEAVFGAFDCPDAGQSTAVRRESTTPIQALNLFNSRFTLDQAEALAGRVEKEAGADPAKQITRAYELALNRRPDAEELREIEPVVREHGLATLCRALFNSNEFLFVP
jgi:mono/diheme cytochrome c family protein